MKKLRDPYRDKQRSYKRDHITNAEYPHAFRIGRPRRKKAFARRSRRRDHQILSSMQNQEEINTETAFSDEYPISMSARGMFRNIPLGEVVAEKRCQRIARMGWNYAKGRYGGFALIRFSPEYRARFVRFIETIIEGKSPYSWEIARSYQVWLERPDDWLMILLRLEPELEERMRSWIALLAERFGDS